MARKYRPQNFDDLIGQDALVRTLKNAIESGRIAHAFMLTGIRGVGKTTTARIIAKALNYTGPDGKAGPTTGPTDDCETCRAISEDRHPDIMEMDAASRTGVDDIREILDGVRYAPTSARYKIYIIDEVHMLSKNAFNALLKTLEEPPEHVKFIFATTEIRKVPVTVLSRCQRFDLRRIDAGTLADYYREISEKEAVSCEEDALAMIARAADGSVRDGLSLLDQAIALGGEKITAAQVKDMLGLADRGLVLDVLEHAMKGECAPALDIMEDLYRKGADPSVVMNDLLDMTHLLTRLRALPQLKEAGQTMVREETERAADLAAKLSMPTLGRAWQILLKGLGEVNMAPIPQKAADMILIRLAYAAQLPDPAELIKKLQDNPSVPQGGAGIMVAAAASSSQGATVQTGAGGGSGARQAQAALAPQPQEETLPQSVASVQTLQDVVSALEQDGAMALASQVYLYVHLVKLKAGRMEFRPAADAPKEFAQTLTRALKKATGERWIITVSGAEGQPTLDQQAKAAQIQKFDAIRQEPLVAEILRIFPDAELRAIHESKEEI